MPSTTSLSFFSCGITCCQPTSSRWKSAQIGVSTSVGRISPTRSKISRIIETKLFECVIYLTVPTVSCHKNRYLPQPPTTPSPLKIICLYRRFIYSYNHILILTDVTFIVHILQPVIVGVSFFVFMMTILSSIFLILDDLHYKHFVL